MDNSYKPDSILEFEKEHGILFENRTGVSPFFNSFNSFQLDQLGRVVSLKIYGIKSLNKISLFLYLQELFLSDSQITKIEGLDNLANLTSLYLMGVQISKIEGLDNLTNLENLYLLGSRISKIEGLDNLTNLENLYLFGSQISKIEGLDNLTNLRSLYISGSQISKIEGLDGLTNLRSLNLSRTRISKIERLDKLVRLNELCLSDSQIEKIEKLDNLTKLTDLDLSDSQIQKIEGLDKLTNLTWLNLSRSQISKIEGLNNLKKLTRLDLSRTQISEIENIDRLRLLKFLDLSEAKIQKIDGKIASTLSQLDLLYVNDNPFLYDNDIILEARENHRDDVLNLIEEQKEKHICFEYPYKVMLLGNHSSGKSSFLKHYDCNYEHEGSTHILHIFKSLKEGYPKVVFYDFGGQDYYHGIYQAFFTNEALNLLFWQDNTDCNERANDCDGINILNFNRLYWLSQIRYASHRKALSYQKSEEDTFVIQTHADKSKQRTLGYKLKGEKYEKFVVEEFFVAFDWDEGTSLDKVQGYNYAIEYLKSRLRDTVDSKNGKRSYPESQVSLYKKVQRLQQTVGYRYTEIGKLLKGYTKGVLKAKLHQLYRKGEVLYYRWSEELEDVVWLNPVETVKHIHTILSKKSLIKEQGRVSEKKMKDAFEENTLLLRLLSLEKVVFHDVKKQTYIIPGYLPLAGEDEAYSWLTLGFITPNFTLKFEFFIPFGLINQLICYYGSGENELKRYWRDQLIFTLRNEYMVWIALDFEQLMIKVYINSLSSSNNVNIKQLEQEILLDLLCFYWDKLTLQGRIEQEFTSSLFRSLNFENQERERENILKIEKDKIFTERRESPIADLYISVYNPALKEEEQLYVHLETLDDPEKTKSKIMGYPLTTDGQIDKDRGQTISTKRYKHLSVNPELKSVKQIFISYSKADREDLMELNKFLEDLKREEKIEVYYDETTTPGDMIHEVIRQKIVEADYVIALVSQDYLSTKYIREKELPLIEKKGERFVPIILKPCCWMETNISSHYAVLKGKEINPVLKDIHPEQYNAYKAKNWVDAVDEIRKKLFNNKDN